VLRETESHLREAAAALEAEGLAPTEAARTAVERFGEVEAIARQVEADRPPRSVPRRSLLVVALVGALAAAGAAVALTGSQTPYGIVVSGHATGPVTNGVIAGLHASLVQLDPHTLRPLSDDDRA
jgi:hypothetical protein